MNMRTVLALAATAVFLAGCATRQMPVLLAENALGGSAGRVGVVMTPLPKVDTYFPGASCLLCLAAASIANSSLTTHTQTRRTRTFRNSRNASLTWCAGKEATSR